MDTIVEGFEEEEAVSSDAPSEAGVVDGESEGSGSVEVPPPPLAAHPERKKERKGIAARAFNKGVKEAQSQGHDLCSQECCGNTPGEPEPQSLKALEKAFLEMLW